MTPEQQEKWLNEKCKEMRRENQTDLREEWRRKQDEFYREINGDRRTVDLWRLFLDESTWIK
ncbi:hypothetical protein [Citrobacter freundii]|uniref:hypothetical protein n=1 Tax=Citrobacter freundii TaxID=546 RepID=UPI00149553FC|nr:hypothetical protein [Citrobacter freundii]HCW3069869.1 hypothetical protein [Citrobacter freundii]HCW3103752.1 hypothetical protein [Citrobacter freundii]HCW3129123.1 hypothetical protein [Citrobacter freundii]HCW3558002.1 hypothetical protein [Citrobacter freundii]